MYIGPWQEYNLSRASKAPRKPTVDRADIEQALLNSLDPESARKAIEALYPVLENAEIDSRRHQQKVSASDFLSTQPVQGRQLRVNSGLSEHYFPPISGASTPSSVRSTVSEPIQFSRYQQYQPLSDRSVRPVVHGTNKGSNSRLPKLQLSNLTTNNKPPNSASRVKATTNNSTHQHDIDEGNVQPPYNAAAVISLLKLEESQRPPKHPDFAQFWKWKEGDLSEFGKQTQTAAAGGGGGGGGGGKQKKTDPAERKLLQVKKMHELYASQALTSIQRGSSSLTPIPTSPIRTRQEVIQESAAKSNRTLTSISPPSSPKIMDMDLTSEDFTTISKYFKSTNGYPFNSSSGAVTMGSMHASQGLQSGPSLKEDVSHRTGRPGPIMRVPLDLDDDDDDDFDSQEIEVGVLLGGGTGGTRRIGHLTSDKVTGESIRKDIDLSQLSSITRIPSGVASSKHGSSSSSSGNAKMSSPSNYHAQSKNSSKQHSDSPPLTGYPPVSTPTSDRKSERRPPGSPSLDELYTGSGASDSLLKWSMNLDFDLDNF